MLIRYQACEEYSQQKGYESSAASLPSNGEDALTAASEDDTKAIKRVVKIGMSGNIAPIYNSSGGVPGYQTLNGLANGERLECGEPGSVLCVGTRTVR